MRLHTLPVSPTKRPLTPQPIQDDDEDDAGSRGGSPPAHIDSPLESLGKAITDPAREASGEAEHRPPQRERK